MENSVKKTTLISLIAISIVTTGCSGLSEREQRALSGGAIGAAGGAAIGLITGGSAVTGALIGGAGGAAVGALTGKDGKKK
jgi:osmotically inducible lipoprotein OsmB